MSSARRRIPKRQHRSNLSSLQKYFFTIFSFAVVVYLCLGLSILGYYQLIDNSSQQLPVDSFKSRKLILLWNSPQRIESAAFGTGHEAFINAKCPVSDCELIANSDSLSKLITKSSYQLLSAFDAILINVHELWLSTLLPVTYQRPRHQRVVFFTQESPLSSELLNVSQLDNIFNWTMTYNSKSDIQLLYGRVIKRTALNNQQSFKINNKTGTKVVWMASHCPTFSGREEYVKQLSKLIPIDVYGDCGNLTCPRNKEHWISQPECYDTFSSLYKFYLSFENSICVDYVTEKFFNILQTDMIPVVMGGADYASRAPPHSYIDVLRFKGPEELADYLQKLDSNDRLYAEYFEWRNRFTVESGVEQMTRHAFCDLCAKLNRHDEPEKYYPSLESFWDRVTQCFGSWNTKI